LDESGKAGAGGAMTLLDPTERSLRGTKLQAELTGAPAREPATLLEASWRDYVFAEVWGRPGLDLRSRFFISMATAACADDAAATAAYVRGALDKGGIALAELREAALHMAVYAGWSYGGVLDDAVSRVATERGIAPAAYAPIRESAWDPKVRLEEGSESFLHNMKFGGPPPQTAYFEGGILNFVFGEMWNRPGLDQRARRWLTLVGVGNSSSRTPIRSHVWSAMASGNASRDEMLEFVLQFAIHAGWPRASVMQAAVLEQAPRVEKGLPFEV
jgi:4-carboxymuconolactone decarboxylase